LLIQQNSTQCKNPLEIAGFLLLLVRSGVKISLDDWLDNADCPENL
jgi:hypothetical protein